MEVEKYSYAWQLFKKKRQPFKVVFFSIYKRDALLYSHFVFYYFISAIIALNVALGRIALLTNSGVGW